MQLETTNQKTYQSFPGARPSEMVVYAPEMNKGRIKGKMESLTQHKRDFGLNKKIKPASPIAPAPSTITLKFNNE